MASQTNDNNNNTNPHSTNRKRGAEALQDTLLLPNATRIAQLRLEAIFHPKFDNEHVRDNKAVRQRMLSKKPGYLEVSLKHSGSLVLWSGGCNVYSKNAVQNVYSATALVLLHQSVFSTKKQFEIVSNYIQQHRLTLSFECVTATLGDHGQRPRRDFLVLTAVADRARAGCFYDTVQLLEFAQRFHLPHNDYWICSEPHSMRELFVLYDTLRETGTAETVLPALSALADQVVPSSVPHPIFQGNILEGLVIRHVSNTKYLSRLEGLCATAAENLQQQQQQQQQGETAAANKRDDNPWNAIDLRRLHDACSARFSNANYDQFDHQLVEQVRQLSSRVITRRYNRVDLPALTKHLVDSTDTETRQIARLLQSVDNISRHVHYSVSEINHDRLICTVHVVHDATFYKYQRQKGATDLQLFRGFSIELVVDREEENSKRSSNPPLSTSAMEVEEESVHDSEVLMLKMKLLPYMVRTFGCRNGLKRLQQGGTRAYLSYTQDLLTRWNVSKAARDEWMPFFRAWSQYAHRALHGKVMDAAKDLPPLTDSNYLDHLELFESLYRSNELPFKDEDTTKAAEFRGLLVVVAVKNETAATVADFVANQLGGAERIDNVKSISADKMAMATERGRGLVCSTIVEGGFGSLRKLSKNYSDDIFIALFECSTNDMNQMLLPKQQEGRVVGMLKGWRKTQCSKIFELPRSSLWSGDAMDVDGETNLSPDEKMMQMIFYLKEKSVIEEKSGALVFFPGIPGCGKSSLTSATERDLRIKLQESSRQLVLQIGDKTKGKYWPTVTGLRQKDRSSVFVADKNAPPTIWSQVGGICGTTNAIAIPVLPDKSALQTTKIIGTRNLESSNDRIVHVYPFSLRYLAACMARVLARPAKSHAGKLDSGTDRAALIVVMFYSFYRNVSADDFLSAIKKKMANSIVTVAPIEVPFFRDSSGSESLPPDLQDLLVEALQLRLGCEKCKIDATRSKNNHFDAMEKRLRDVVSKYSAELLSSCAEESTSKEVFAALILEKVGQIDSALLQNSEDLGIRLASIDVETFSVHALLSKLENDGTVSFPWPSRGHSENKYDPSLGFVKKTHVTLAHRDNTAQEEIQSTFGEFLGSRTALTPTRLYFNDRVAAFEVAVDKVTVEGNSLPRSKNDFVHITVWCGEGTRPHEANGLPGLAASNDATVLELSAGEKLSGVVSLWSIE